ncbi:hypothetical protein GCM10011514_12070 [Emticicia aquatilis]|uniref:Uncharacterized protein n=1 Tax=Emticicia aquatilis TaxID=1537369 RepID=A0A916YK96_9BACT|nr:hypothetical protein GCM10011514_12070 [Emticicia aquatilis]
MIRRMVEELQKIKQPLKSIALKKPSDSTQIQLSNAKICRDKQKLKRQDKLEKTLIERIALIRKRSNSHILDIFLINIGQKKAK